MLGDDFAAYRAKHVDGAPIEFVIPAEGTIQVPYVMCLVKNAPHMENGKAVIDFVLSEKGQKHWADNFLRPVVGDLETTAPERSSCRHRNTPARGASTTAAWRKSSRPSAKRTCSR